MTIMTKTPSVGSPSPTHSPLAGAARPGSSLTGLGLALGLSISLGLGGCAAPDSARESAEQLALVSHAAQVQLADFEEARARRSEAREQRLSEHVQKLEQFEGEVALQKRAWRLVGTGYERRLAIVEAIRRPAPEEARSERGLGALSGREAADLEVQAGHLANIAQAFAAVADARGMVENRDYLVAFYTKVRASIAAAKAQAEALQPEGR